MLIVFLLSWFLPHRLAQRLRSEPVSTLVLETEVDGVNVRSVPLPGPEEGSVEVELESEYGYNLLSVSHRGASMISSDCRGGDCLRFPEITHTGGVIACLPHKLLVRLISLPGKPDMFEAPDETGGNQMLDAVAY